MKNKIKKNIINIFFVICIFSFVLLSFIKSLFKPIDILERENRYANKYEKISFNSYLNSKTQSNIENTLSDQILLSSKLKSANNIFKATLIKNYVDIYFNNNKIDYLSLSNVNFYGKDNLVYNKFDLNKEKSNLDIKIRNYNSLIKKHPNIDFYVYYIERDIDINFNDNSKSGIYEYIISNMKNIKSSKLEIDNFETFDKYFLKTDHHWNYEGAKKGYEDVLKLLNINSSKKAKGIKCISKNYSGTKSSSSIFNKVVTEKFCIYNYDFSKLRIMVNGKEQNYGHQEEYILDNVTLPVTYRNVYGSDNGKIIFESSDKTKDNILIIGESYDNAILKLLAESFNTTISIDLRNYKRDIGKEFDFNYYIEKYNINKVLFIGNVSFYTMKDFLIN